MTQLGFEWLVTWVWQTSVLTLVVAGGLRLVSSLKASTRYVIWATTLCAVVTLAMLSLFPGRVAESLDSGPSKIAIHDASVTRASKPPTFPLVLPAPPRWTGLTAAALWLMWSLTAGGRILRDIVGLRRAKRTGWQLPAAVERRLVGWQSLTTRRRHVRLRVSSSIPTACMLGLGTPIIAVPKHLVDALTPPDLDRVILHEYAHAQRRDDWTGTVQAVVEVFLGWHPAVWWIGRNLRLEREVACDEWVVGRLGSARTYASCLSRVAHLSTQLSTSQQSPLLAPGVTTRHSVLLTRVDRLLDPCRNGATRARGAATVTSLATVIGASVALSQLPPAVLVSSTAIAGRGTPPQQLGFAIPVASPLPPIWPGFSPQETSWPTAAIHDVPVSSRYRPERERLLDAINVSERVDRTISSGVLSSRSDIGNAAIDLGNVRLGASQNRGTVSVSTQPASQRHLASPQLTSPLPATHVGVDVISVPLLTQGRPNLPVDLVETVVSNEQGWKVFAVAGRAIGSAATHAGVATASAFENVGSSIARAFRPGS